MELPAVRYECGMLKLNNNIFMCCNTYMGTLSKLDLVGRPPG
jgi:hypothetical protein